ncbi:MAG: saccharopine dehydrogenase family protein [Gammaproteobacteria bacterium]
MADRTADLDLIIYGASGFTGRLVLEYIHTHYAKSGLKYGVAGRNRDKLEALCASLDTNHAIPIIEADSDHLPELLALAGKTRCILSTVGPYQLYGSKLVEACAQTGTDYVDITGEPGWMHEMITKHQQQAQQSGARLVFSCGFDSIPFDLGVHFLQTACRQKTGQSSNRVRGRVKAMQGTFSGGTFASMQATMAALSQNKELIKILINPFSLTMGFQGPDQPDDSKPMEDVAIGQWVAPFVMAPINTKNIHRSNTLMNYPYGQDFQYDEMMLLGPGEEGKARAEQIDPANPMGLAADQKPPQPGEGPSKEEREAGYYELLFIAETDKGQLTAQVTGDKDPGYGSTSKMIAQSALCLIQDCTALEGGFYTPAAAMADTLTQRLIAHAGLTFDIL